MKKVVMLGSLFFIVCFCSISNCWQHPYPYELQKRFVEAEEKWKKTLQECDKVNDELYKKGVELDQKQESKNLVHQQRICYDLKRIMLNLETSCRESKKNGHFLWGSDECVAFNIQEEMLGLCDAQVSRLEKIKENTPENKKLIEATNKRDEAVNKIRDVQSEYNEARKKLREARD